MKPDIATPEGLPELMAAVKRRSATTVQEPAAKMFPVAAHFAEKARREEAERRKAEEEIIAMLNGSDDPRALIGRNIPGQGVFIGRCVIKGLSQSFNVFAAPADLTDASGNRKTFTHVDAVRRISELEDWHGFDGTNYANDKEFYKALQGNCYNGGWVIPSKELLRGKDAEGRNVQPDNLCDCTETGEFKGTFITKPIYNCAQPDAEDWRRAHWYWSSSEDPADPSSVYRACFQTRMATYSGKDEDLCSCRPVRLAPVPQGGPV